MTSPFAIAVSPKKRIVRVRFAIEPGAVATATRKVVVRRKLLRRERKIVKVRVVQILVLLRSKDWPGEIGEMILELKPIERLQGMCRNDLFHLRPKWRLSADSKSLYKVHSSEIVENHFRSKGYGLLMYVAGLVLASAEGTGIASDECFWGSTSEAADRVWRSARFASVADVSGQVAFLRSVG
jgi:hypothetical protein